MIYKAVYSDARGYPLSEITFDAGDLTNALQVICTTQVTPDGATRIIIEPLVTSDP